MSTRRPTPNRSIQARRVGHARGPLLTLPGAWVRDAACSPETAELFFPITDTGPAAADTARARAICARCPVRRQCQEDAETTGQRWGIWGGTTEADRANRHRAASRAA